MKTSNILIQIFTVVTRKQKDQKQNKEVNKEPIEAFLRSQKAENIV